MARFSGTDLTLQAMRHFPSQPDPVRHRWRGFAYLVPVCLALTLLVGWAAPLRAQSSGCDSYVTAVQTLEAAKFRFHADLRGVAAADGSGAGAFQFWVNPATAEWILLELGVGTEEEGLRGCIKLSGRDYKEYDIGLTPQKE